VLFAGVTVGRFVYMFPLHAACCIPMTSGCTSQFIPPYYSIRRHLDKICLCDFDRCGKNRFLRSRMVKSRPKQCRSMNIASLAHICRRSNDLSNALHDPKPHYPTHRLARNFSQEHAHSYTPLAPLSTSPASSLPICSERFHEIEDNAVQVRQTCHLVGSSS